MKHKMVAKKLICMVLVLVFVLTGSVTMIAQGSQRFPIYDPNLADEYFLRFSFDSEPISHTVDPHPVLDFMDVYTVSVGTTIFGEIVPQDLPDDEWVWNEWIFLHGSNDPQWTVIDRRNASFTFDTVGRFMVTAEAQLAVFEIEVVPGQVTTPPPPPPPAGVTATPTQAPVLVNGQNVAFQAYHIGGNNFFRLRDIAYILNGTSAQFNVEWDAANSAILLQTQTPYTPVGGEMPGAGTGPVTATPTQAAVLLDGVPVNLRAYHIDGNNFFMLRDLGTALGFDVDWDEAARTVLINTD